MTVELRDYQAGSRDAVIAHAKKGERRIVVCQPVGSGKTEVMASLCAVAKFPLVIAPLVDLMRQARDRLELRLGERCDIEQGGSYAESIEGLRRRVIVGSRDSLLSRERYKAKAYDRVSLVMVDECHVGITPRLEQMLNHFEQRGATIVGFSATPYKGKGKSLRWWPRPQVVYSLRQGIDDAWLVPPKCHLSSSTSIDMSAVDDISSEWSDQNTLASILTAEHFIQEVTSLVLQTYRRQPSVIYAKNRRQACLIQEVFARYGVTASLVHCRQNQVERKANMDAFLSGQTQIIVNVGILGYGWDHPDLRNIYMATPTRSLSRYEQRLGRGTRALKGTLTSGMTREERIAAIASSAKPFFSVYDLTDSSGRHQLLSALDVLDAKLRKSKDRRQKALELAASDEGVLATDAIRELDDIDAAAAEELRARRQKLIVGVTFEHSDRDLFDAPVAPKKERGWRMRWGK